MYEGYSCVIRTVCVPRIGRNHNHLILKFCLICIDVCVYVYNSDTAVGGCFVVLLVVSHWLVSFACVL